MVKKYHTKEIEYDLVYSNKLPPRNDIFINRNTLFKKTLKEFKIDKRDRILEIGCDKGYFVNFLQQKLGKEKVFGIDLNKEIISASPFENLFEMDALKTTFPNNYFSKIYSFHTIEHIPDLYKFFKESERILNKKGVFVLVYPAELFRGMQSLRVAFKTYGNPLIARKLHIHKLTPKKIKKYIKGTSLKHKKSKLLFALLPQFITILVKD